MVDWRERASGGLSLLEDDSLDAGERTRCIIKHVLDDNNLDGYIGPRNSGRAEVLGIWRATISRLEAGYWRKTLRGLL